MKKKNEYFQCSNINYIGNSYESLCTTYRMNFHREKLYRLMGLNRMRIDSKRTKKRLDIDLLSNSDK